MSDVFAPGDAPRGGSPRSAYVHVPFCRHRCGYCNFTVVSGRDDLAPAYLDALETELGWLGKPRVVDTLYLGGGTPTRLEARGLDRLLTLAGHWFPATGDRHGEWTVEANPADLDAERIAVLADHGVTRVSLGVQSLDDAKLRRLERDHTAAVVRRVVDRLHDAGFDVAVDLIFAAPDETLPAWQRDVEACLQLGASHVSTYGLTYEKGTTFWSRRGRAELIEADDDRQRAMYEHAIDRLTATGYEHYEVSNHARPGRRSRHNEAYWAGREYYAAGPGAARYVGGVRETNHRSVFTWLRRVQAGESPVAESEELTPEERARERLVFGLRRLEGVDRDEFVEATGFMIDALASDTIRRFAELGLLHADESRVRLTREGLLVSDALWPELL